MSNFHFDTKKLNVRRKIKFQSFLLIILENFPNLNFTNKLVSLHN